MSPEIAVQPPWRNVFCTPFFKKHLTLVAVDEAHCIPEWLGLLAIGCIVLVMYAQYRGSEFRTSFTRIGGLRALADVPFMALSASAPPSIAKVIEDSLQLKSPVHIAHNLDRPNIFLSCTKSRGLTVSK